MDAQISLGRENRRDFMRGLRIDWVKKMSHRVGVGEQRGRALEMKRAFRDQVKPWLKGLSKESTRTTTA